MMKFTDPLQKLQTPSKITMWRCGISVIKNYVFFTGYGQPWLVLGMLILVGWAAAKVMPG